MGFGITKVIRKFNISLNEIEFSFRKKLLGFDNANAFFRRLDKESVIQNLKKNKATIGNNCDIEVPIIIHNCQDFSNLIIGNNCHIGKNCFFDLRDKVIIEENVVVAMQATFITHIDMNKSELRSLFPATNAPIKVCKDSYIGAGSTILKGVTLEEKCFIAAGSVVTQNVNSRTLVGGIPAKLIKALPIP